LELITTPRLPQSEIETIEQLFGNWFDPIETSLRERTSIRLSYGTERGISVLSTF
jgi:hypothetical protein